jgi:hypothetical protein
VVLKYRGIIIYPYTSAVKVYLQKIYLRIYYKTRAEPCVILPLLDGARRFSKHDVAAGQAGDAAGIGDGELRRLTKRKFCAFIAHAFSFLGAPQVKCFP